MTTQPLPGPELPDISGSRRRDNDSRHRDNGSRYRDNGSRYRDIGRRSVSGGRDVPVSGWRAGATGRSAQRSAAALVLRALIVTALLTPTSLIAPAVLPPAAGDALDDALGNALGGVAATPAVGAQAAQAGVTVSPVTLAMSEGGVKLYTVVLTSDPGTDNEVVVTPATDSAFLNVAPTGIPKPGCFADGYTPTPGDGCTDVPPALTALTFTSGDPAEADGQRKTRWDVPQRVTVTALDNPAAGSGPNFVAHTITNSVTGSGDYASVTADDVTRHSGLREGIRERAVERERVLPAGGGDRRLGAG